MNVTDPTSVLEVAVLNVRPGQAEAFLSAFAQARNIITAMPGQRRTELRRCAEHDHQFLLMVEWDSVEAHEVGFRGSEAYQQWRALLHSFYDPFPTVLHYETVQLPGISG